MRYQIQEMLRIEKIFEEAGIQDELDAYNPLVPDGTQLQGDDADRVRGRGRADRGARAPRSASSIACGWRSRACRGCTRSPTRICRAKPRPRRRPCISCASSSTPAMVSALRDGAGLAIGVDHPRYEAVHSRARSGDARGARRRSRLGELRPSLGGDLRARWTTLRATRFGLSRSGAPSRSSRFPDGAAQVSRSIVHTRNSSGAPSRCGRVSRRTSDIPHFAMTRPDAGFRTRCIALSTSTSRRENASAMMARAAAVAYPLPQ